MRRDERGYRVDAALSVSLDMRDDRARRASAPLPNRQSAAPARTGGADPLAQLARLIAKDEAFQATTRNTGRSAPRAALSVDPKDAPSLGDPRENIWPGADWDGDEASPLIGSAICQDTAGAPHEPYQNREDQRPDLSYELPNHRRRLRMFMALIGLVLAVAASVAAYWLWTDALTSVDKAPATVASVTPGKIMLPPADVDGRSDERLRDQSDEQSVKGADRLLPGEEKPSETAPAATAPQAVPPAGVLYGPAPSQPAAPTSAAAAPESPADPVPDQPPQSNNVQPAPEATKLGATHGATYVVQLSSQRSEAAAQTTSKLLQTKYPDLFSGRQPYIRRSDLGNRGVYYRVLVGPLATIGEANQLCGSLKKSGGDCVVQKN